MSNIYEEKLNFFNNLTKPQNYRIICKLIGLILSDLLQTKGEYKMPEYEEVTCPRCSARLTAKDPAVGKSYSCSECGVVFTITQMPRWRIKVTGGSNQISDNAFSALRGNGWRGWPF